MPELPTAFTIDSLYETVPGGQASTSAPETPALGAADGLFAISGTADPALDPAELVASGLPAATAFPTASALPTGSAGAVDAVESVPGPAPTAGVWEGDSAAPAAPAPADALTASAPALALPAGSRLAATPFQGGPRIMVQWAPEATEAARTAVLGGFGGLRKELIHTAPMRARGQGVLEVIQLPAGANLQAVLAAYEATPGVRFAEVDQLLLPQAISNDPEYRNQLLWGMYGSDSPSSVGPAGTTNAYGSNAEAAWEKGFTGSKSVFVGLIDQGIDFEHPDLAPNIWFNPFESLDGIDNDGNGYVDDVRGWNFFDNNNSIYDYLFDDHGTHAAGIIGAVGGNDIGVAGVNWDVTMISAKFLSEAGGYVSGAIQAIDYITDLKWRHGLNIVATNNSWAVSLYDDTWSAGSSRALYDAIVRSAQQDILFVASAGNNSTNNDNIPRYPSAFDTTADAGYDAIVTVAAITNTGALASKSNYGSTTVDLGAPGVDINSTIPWGQYDFESGSSVAAPHVTGAIALYAASHPGSTAEQIRMALLNSAIPTPSLQGKTVSGGRLDVLNFLNTTVPPSFSITADQPYRPEGQSGVTPFQFQITRHGDTSGLATVAWQVAGAGAAPANRADFVGQEFPSGTVTFAPGVARQSITVQVQADSLTESTEAFSVTLANPSAGHTLAANQSASGMILNDDDVILAFNPTAITIPSSGSAFPFPSSVMVSAPSNHVVTSLEVTLYNFYHNSPDDVDILLVGPTGAKSVLLSDAGGINPVDRLTLTFNAQAATGLPDSGPLQAGSWLPTDHYSADAFNEPNNDLFSPAAPAGPYSADLSVFNGTNPTGTWRLFVQDDAVTGAGKIIDGWSLAITTQADTPNVSLAVSPGVVNEDGTSNLVYTFSRTGSLSNPLTVKYSVAGSATLGTDYSGIAATPASKSVTFAAGAATATVMVDPSADAEVEADETVALTLQDGAGYTIGTAGAVISTIQDDDTQTLEALGGTRLLRGVGNRLFAQAGGGSPVGLKFRSRPILQGDFGGWEALAAENFSGVNQVIWKNTSGNCLSLWTMDSNWNWLSSVGEWGLNSAGALVQESKFGMDFNGNGIIG